MAVSCSSLHMFAHMILGSFRTLGGILHKDQTMINLDKNVHRFDVIRFRCGKVLVFKDERECEAVTLVMTALHVQTDTSFAVCSISHFRDFTNPQA